MACNRLAEETSPYLLQHAGNPVDWYPWGAEALGRARDENRPIFLSVGYSSCHWCHVMAHESFENADIAAFMNANFVNIKVDREERPDIDDVYQKACQAATGQGGWPLSAFLTPDQKPFYVGTYFPPLDSHGRPGFGSVCRQLAQAWRERPADVARSADGFVATLGRAPGAGEPAALDRALLDEAAVNLYQLGDATYGGFGSAPKFPNSACVSFLLHYSRITGLAKFGEFALKTLDRMARGGMFDQLGGGFHRYSTDARWLVPHFEKMLYDNALIPVNYAEAYQLTRDPFYLDVMRRTLDFVLRDMRSPGGAFYSAYDADSGGGEGRYYVWSKAEIRDVLGDEAGLFCLYYDVTDGGNWEGDNILCNSLRMPAVAFKLGIPEAEARKRLADSSQKLLAARARRQAPGLDDKVLASWNALMVSALARGYRVSGDDRYLAAAKECVAFIRDNMFCDGWLMRTYKGGGARIRGYLDDHAYLAAALLDVFEADADPGYLGLAAELGGRMAGSFWDPGAGAFFMSSGGHEELVVRPRSDHDLSLPSGSSAAASVMLRLHHLTGDGEMLDISDRVTAGRAREAAENPFAFGVLLNTVAARVAGMTEVAVVNTRDGGLCRDVMTEYVPGAVMACVRSAEQLAGLSKHPFFAGKGFGDDTDVYVCRNKTCSPPLRDMDGIRRALSSS